MTIEEGRLKGLLNDWLQRAALMDLGEFLVSVSHPSVVVRTPNGQVGGQELIRDYTGYLKVAFPDLEMEVDHLAVMGDRVVLQFTLEGKHSGPLGFILPTQRVVRAPAALIARVDEDELIHELWAYLNMAVALVGQIDATFPGVATPFPGTGLVGFPLPPQTPPGG